MPLASLAPRLAASAVLCLPVAAAAAPLRAPAPTPSPIYGGTIVDTCGWPSVVQIEDFCTGTLVHPEVVIYAGHCSADVEFVRFGEDGENPARVVETEECWADMVGAGDGHDYAVCKLAEPVTDVPIVPILMGCEVAALSPGTEVALIGFGEADSEPTYGVKRETTAEIVGLEGYEIFIYDESGQDTCYGDSGGPVAIRLEDGTWRVFGITSYGVGDCGTGTYYSMMHTDIAWFEEKTGIDLTPCHLADGEWDPSPACGMFPTDPATPAGTWADGCSGGPVAGANASCGPPYGAEPDTTPPLVEITAPDQGTEFMTVDKLPLTVTATARDAIDKPEGWGIAAVYLIFNDYEVPNSAQLVPPYSWNVGLPPGPYLVQARAVDHAGNEALSPPIAIGINEPPPELPEPPDPTTGETGVTGVTPTTSADDTSTGTPPADDSSGGDASTGDTAGADDDGGCGCRSPRPTAGLLALLPLLARRRRR
jgi:hypothetical protein